MRRSFSLFSGFSSDSTVPAGSLANASSVGANTVNGPAPFNVSISPAAVRALASVVNDPAATAVSTMSLSARAEVVVDAPRGIASAVAATVNSLNIDLLLLVSEESFEGEQLVDAGERNESVDTGSERRFF